MYIAACKLYRIAEYSQLCGNFLTGNAINGIFKAALSLPRVEITSIL
jgi:hypothetical protein